MTDQLATLATLQRRASELTARVETLEAELAEIEAELIIAVTNGGRAAVANVIFRETIDSILGLLGKETPAEIGKRLEEAIKTVESLKQVDAASEQN